MDITSLLSQVATSGIMGVIAVIEGVICYRLFMLLLQKDDMLLLEKDKHRENVEKLTREQTMVTKAYQNSIDILSAKLDGMPKNKQ